MLYRLVIICIMASASWAGTIDESIQSLRGLRSTKAQALTMEAWRVKNSLNFMETNRSLYSNETYSLKKEDLRKDARKIAAQVPEVQRQDSFWVEEAAKARAVTRMERVPVVKQEAAVEQKTVKLEDLKGVPTYRWPVAWARKLYKNKCKKEWPADFSMQSYCMKRQEAGYQQMQTRDPGIPSSVEKMMKERCSLEWLDDYSMQSYCLKGQAKGYKTMNP